MSQEKHGKNSKETRDSVKSRVVSFWNKFKPIGQFSIVTDPNPAQLYVPPEMWCHAFSFLPDSELRNIRLVSRQWNGLAEYVRRMKVKKILQHRDITGEDVFTGQLPFNNGFHFGNRISTLKQIKSVLRVPANLDPFQSGAVVITPPLLVTENDQRPLEKFYKRIPLLLERFGGLVISTVVFFIPKLDYPETLMLERILKLDTLSNLLAYSCEGCLGTDSDRLGNVLPMLGCVIGELKHVQLEAVAVASSVSYTLNSHLHFDFKVETDFFVVNSATDQDLMKRKRKHVTIHLHIMKETSDSDPFPCDPFNYVLKWKDGEPEADVINVVQQVGCITPLMTAIIHRFWSEILDSIIQAPQENLHTIKIVKKGIKRRLPPELPECTSGFADF